MLAAVAETGINAPFGCGHQFAVQGQIERKPIRVKRRVAERVDERQRIETNYGGQIGENARHIHVLKERGTISAPDCTQVRFRRTQGDSHFVDFPGGVRRREQSILCV